MIVIQLCMRVRGFAVNEITPKIAIGRESGTLLLTRWRKAILLDRCAFTT